MLPTASPAATPTMLTSTSVPRNHSTDPLSPAHTNTTAPVTVTDAAWTSEWKSRRAHRVEGTL
jgi:hypothetical protein